MTSTSLSQLYQRVIEDHMGLLTRVDDDGDVHFRHPEYGHFYIALDAERDPEYLSICYPNFMSEESTPLGVAELLPLINQTNRSCKAAHAWLVEHAGGFRISGSVGCFLAACDQAPSAELIQVVLPRNLAALRHLARTVQQACQEQAAASTH
jgi:hypothetical protein